MKINRFGLTIFYNRLTRSEYVVDSPWAFLQREYLNLKRKTFLSLPLGLLFQVLNELKIYV